MTILPSILEDYPSLKVLVLSSLEDYATIRSVISLGVHGYISKSQPPELIFEAINTVLSGEIYLCPESKKINNRNAEDDDEGSHVVHLSTREREVLTHILAEKTTKEIADLLYISEKTVEYYRGSLFMKFGVKNVSGLVKRAILQGYFN